MSVATSYKITLVGNDEVGVSFDSHHVNEFASIKTIMEDMPTDNLSVPVSFASKTLLLLKELVTLKDTTGIPFKQSSEIKSYRGIETKVPTYSGINDPWNSTPASGIYYDKLTKIPVEDLCATFAAADYLGCDDILHGVAYVLIQYMFNYTGDVRKHLSAHSRTILAKIHIANI